MTYEFKVSVYQDIDGWWVANAAYADFCVFEVTEDKALSKLKDVLTEELKLVGGDLTKIPKRPLPLTANSLITVSEQLK